MTIVKYFGSVTTLVVMIVITLMLALLPVFTPPADLENPSPLDVFAPSAAEAHKPCYWPRAIIWRDRRGNIWAQGSSYCRIGNPHIQNHKVEVRLQKKEGWWGWTTVHSTASKTWRENSLPVRTYIGSWKGTFRVVAVRTAQTHYGYDADWAYSGTLTVK